MDKRQHVRVNVALPCHLTIGKRGSLIGDTVNISRGGLLVRCHSLDSLERLPEVGDVLTIDIALPPSPHARRKCLHCQATIVRILTAEGLPHLALSFARLQFRQWRPVFLLPEEQSIEVM